MNEKVEPTPQSEVEKHNLRVFADFLGVIKDVMDKSDNPAQVVEDAKAALEETFKAGQQPEQPGQSR